MVIEGNGFTMVTCDPNEMVAPIHPKAMITVLEPGDHERWLRGSYESLAALQPPYRAERIAAISSSVPCLNLVSDQYACETLPMKIVLAISALISLSACSDPKSIEYFKAHAAERSTRLDACVAASDFSRECRNVRQSQFDADGIPAKDGSPITT